MPNILNLDFLIKYACTNFNINVVKGDLINDLFYIKSAIPELEYIVFVPIFSTFKVPSKYNISVFKRGLIDGLLYKIYIKHFRKISLSYIGHYHWIKLPNIS